MPALRIFQTSRSSSDGVFFSCKREATAFALFLQECELREKPYRLFLDLWLRQSAKPSWSIVERYASFRNVFLESVKTVMPPKKTSAENVVR